MNAKSSPSAIASTEPSRGHFSYLRLLLAVSGSIFLEEIVAMIFVHRLPLPYYWLALIDAGVMAIFVAPVLYFLSFRPLIRHIDTRRQAETTAQSERRRFNDILETLPGYLVLLTPDYHVPFANHFFRERFGEARGRRCYEYLFGRDTPCEICETYKVLKTMQPGRWEWTGPDGHLYDVYDFPFTDVDGTTLILEMGIDITEQKQAEGAVRQLSRVVEQTEDTVVVTNRAGRIEYVNPSFERLTGYTKEEALGKTPRVIKSDHHDQEFYQNLWNTILAGEVFQSEMINRKKNGEIYYEVKTITPLRDTQGNITHFVATGKDITEHKLDEEKLRNAYDELELRVQERTEELSRANSNLEAEIIERRQVEGTLRKANLRLQDQAEELDAQAEELRLQTEELRDINEKLSKSEATLQSILNATQESIWLFSPDGVILMANTTALSRMPIPAEEIIGQRFSALMPADVAQPRMKYLTQVVNTGQPLEFEDQRAGIIFHHNFYPVIDANGRVTGVVSFSRDITERKRAEEALRLSEERFRLALANSPIVVANLDKQLRYTWIYNPLANYQAEDILGKQVGLSADTEEKAKILALLEDLLTHGTTVRWETTIQTAAEEKFFTSYAEPLKDLRGEILGVSLVSIDITERKRMETALRENQAWLETLFAAIPSIVLEYDANGKVVRADKAALKAIGLPSLDFTRDEIVARLNFRRLNGNSPDKKDLPTSRALRGEKVVDELYLITSADGIERTISVHAAPLYDEANNVSGVVTVWHDITELKQAEQALQNANEELEVTTEELRQQNDEILHTQSVLRETNDKLKIQAGELERINVMLRESEQRTREILESISDGFWSVDNQWQFNYINQRAAQNLGFQPADLLGKNLWDTFPSIGGTPHEQYYHQVMTERTPCHFEVAGSLTLKAYSISVYPSADGISVYWRDITERKQAEEALRLSEEKFALAFANNPAAVALTRLDDGLYLEVNDTWVALTGYHREEVLGRSARKLPIWPSAEAAARFVQELREKGSLRGWEQEFFKKSGEVYVAQLSAQLLTVQNETLILSTLVDITEHKRVQEREQQLNRTLKALNRSNQAMLRSKSEAELLDEVCKIIVEDCGHAMVWIGFKEEDEEKTVRPVASDGFEEGYLETLKITWADTERGRGPTGTAVRTGMSRRCRNMLTDPQFAPWREQALKRGYASSIVLPLKREENTFGAITIYSRQPDSFAEEEEKLLTELAGDLAYGIMALRLQAARAQAEEALRLSEGRYRTLFNSMTEGFALHEIICDESGMPYDYRFLEINPSFERLTGLKREEVTGRTICEVLPNTESYWIETYGQVALTGQPVHFDNYSAALDRHYEVYAYSPAPHQFAVLFVDITERKHAEDALRESENKFSTLFGKAAMPAVLSRFPDHVFIDVNDAWAEAFGYTKQELIGKTSLELGISRNVERRADLISTIRQHTPVRSLEQTLYTKSGEARTVLTNVNTITIRGQEYALASFQDITERKRAEEALQNLNAELELRVQQRTKKLNNLNKKLLNEIKEREEIEQQLRIRTTAMEAAANGIVITDPQGNIQWANPALTQISGYDPHDLLGENTCIFNSGKQGPAFYKQLWETILSGQVWRGEITNQRKDGTLYIEEETITPVRDEHGRIPHFIAVKQDITQRKQAEEELERRNRELQILSESEHKQRQLSEALVQATLILNKSLKLDEVLVLILRQIKEVIPYRLANIALSEGESFYDACHQGDLEWPISNNEFLLESFPLINKVRQSGKPILIRDTRQEPNWVTAEDVDTVRSFLSAPLLVEEKAIGFVNLFSDQPGFFTEEMSLRLVAFAAHATVAIQNAWLFEQVRASSERLQSLSRRLVEIQENERLYIARELHDEAGQMLTSLMLDLVTLESQANQPEAVLKKAAEMEEMLSAISENLHNVAMALRPASLDHLGLVPALRQYVESVGERYKLKASFTAGNFQERLPANMETEIYRIVQEALTNVARHAHASQVDVILTVRDHKLVVMVEDDGKGFDPEKIPETGHLGLFGMRERAEMIGGELVIESKPGKGTTIMVEVDYDSPIVDRG